MRSRGRRSTTSSGSCRSTWGRTPSGSSKGCAANSRSGRECGCSTDARQLPFPPEHFDVVVSVDSWEYFGTDDHYLPYLATFLSSGGQLGVATPAMSTDVRDLGEIPEHIRRLVAWEALAWHSPAWWRQQWELTGIVDVTAAHLQATGWQDWMLWARALLERGNLSTQGTIDMLESDQGELLSFALLAGRKRSPPDG